MPDIFRRTLDKREKEAGLKDKESKTSKPKPTAKVTMTQAEFLYGSDKENKKKEKSVPPESMLKKQREAKFAKGGMCDSKKKYNMGGAVSGGTPIVSGTPVASGMQRRQDRRQNMAQQKQSPTATMVAKGGMIKKKAKK
jgi:hypothetical protein